MFCAGLGSKTYSHVGVTMDPKPKPAAHIGLWTFEIVQHVLLRDFVKHY